MRQDMVVWNCPNCDASACAEADEIAFIAAAHQHCGAVSRDGQSCDRTDPHETHTHRMVCGTVSTWVSALA